MENSGESTDHPLSVSTVARIDEVCDRFDQAIRQAFHSSAPWPYVEDYLGDTIEPVRSKLRKELLAVEVSYRQQATGGGPSARTEISPSTHLSHSKESESRQKAGDATSKQPIHIGRYRIDRILGKGAFGTVYQGYDAQLKRPVAIKVPHRHLVDKPEDIELYLEEAQVVASLVHANIVRVYDLGRTADDLCYVVSEFIDGSDLARRISDRPLSHREAVDVVIGIAEALHHAHRHTVVHRDVKPANILLDRVGKPYLADFGLALKEEDFGGGSGGFGTPAYMSPEQARGEGHLVDGRADIFSLGVVFYEVLTASRPFWATSREETIERIRSLEVRPPRQLDDSIPKELERICLKALAKRAADRYTTALDMADDLRHFLGQTSGVKPVEAAKLEIQVVSSPAAPPLPAALESSKPIKIVPKGIRSFDAQDADFFLQLLPGPRDRDGLPESIRFWKYRIEETDADKTFRLGAIYGPSGCGKSSLVKAGLLTRLDEQVISVYVEATADDTEARLLRGLRRQLPGLQENLNLKESVAALRRGRAIPAGKKVLLVIDQFEQWLHSQRDQRQLPLVEALRQCDGERVQCIVMVRDDFWMAITRFMKEMEVEFVEGRNSAAVDLFDLDHTQKVLAAFGTAFGKLPEKLAEGKDQMTFVEQAARGLAEDGKVVCVRLALFAEMMKGKPWTPASLKAVGGTRGVGATFLEETFSAATAPPEHRYHQKAVRSVLKALLPESGSDIKGYMRPYAELLEASGYAGRPRDFDGLTRILDGELRLITPTDAEGKSDDAAAHLKAGEKYYQLTHDYLVHSLRDWLTRKQKETRRGRAELLLADRASVWNARPENQQLPALWQWFQIKFLTAKKNWTPPQRKMMRKAGKYHTVRGLIVVGLLALLGWGGYEGDGTLKAYALRDRLLDADTSEVPSIVRETASYRRWLDPLLRKASNEAEANKDARKKLRASLALLPVDPGQLDYLKNRLLDAEPREVSAIRDSLEPYKNSLLEELWAVTESPAKRKEQQRLRAASALAKYDPESPRWDTAVANVADELVLENAVFLGQWTDALLGVQDKLVGSLSSIARDPARKASERLAATNILAACGPDRPLLLTPVLINGSDEQFAIIFPLLARLGLVPLRLLEGELELAISDDPFDPQSEAIAQRQARAAVALLRLGQPEKVWPLLEKTSDERVRSYLIHWSARLGVDPQIVIQHWEVKMNAGKRAALLLLLGEFPDTKLTEAQRRPLIEQLLTIFENEADSGLHAASEWLLRRWNCDARLQAAVNRLAGNQARRPGAGVGDKRQWYVNPQNQTFVIVDALRPFRMGSPKGDLERKGNETQHERKIGRCYAIAASPVTKAQFARFLSERPSVKDKMVPASIVRPDDSPQAGITWYEAAEYCNWLSDVERISREQFCYVPNKQGKFAAGMRTKDNYLTLAGYRLPTEAEWEFACRAGTKTKYYFGQSDALLLNYAWYEANSEGHTWPVAGLKPNDLGLFDMHGNVWQWCESPFQTYPQSGLAVADEGGAGSEVTNDLKVPARGGAYDNLPRRLRAAFRALGNPHDRQESWGFRLAQTITF